MNLSWCFDLSQARWIVRLDLFRSTKTQETSLLISCNLWTYNKLKPKILAYYVVNFELIMNFDLSQARWVVRLDLFKSTKTREPRLLLSCKLLTYNKLKPEILSYHVVNFELTMNLNWCFDLSRARRVVRSANISVLIFGNDIS